MAEAQRVWSDEVRVGDLFRDPGGTSMWRVTRLEPNNVWAVPVQATTTIAPTSFSRNRSFFRPPAPPAPPPRPPPPPTTAGEDTYEGHYCGCSLLAKAPSMGLVRVILTWRDLSPHTRALTLRMAPKNLAPWPRIITAHAHATAPGIWTALACPLPDKGAQISIRLTDRALACWYSSMGKGNACFHLTPSAADK